MNSDDNTFKKKVMDVACNMIRTKSMEGINRNVKVQVNDEVFRTRIHEDLFGPKQWSMPSKRVFVCASSSNDESYNGERKWLEAWF